MKTKVTISLHSLMFLAILFAFPAGAKEKKGESDDVKTPPITEKQRKDISSMNEQIRKNDPRPSINADTVEELVKARLPGISRAEAEKIVAYRKKIGVYKYVEQLLDAGIKRETFESIKNRVSLRGKFIVPRPDYGR